jgi:SAM-dependent methyltransferase
MMAVGDRRCPELSVASESSIVVEIRVVAGSASHCPEQSSRPQRAGKSSSSVRRLLYSSGSVLKKLLLSLVRHPAVLDLVRWIIEAGHRGEKRVIRDELAALGGSVLDVPCGTGTYSVFFGADRYTGIDLDSRFVERAGQRFPGKRFLVMDAEAMSFDAASFDHVLLVGFLHHLDEQGVEHALREMHRVLRDGGRFLIIEDCPTRSALNLPGRILQALDEGGRIRPGDYYEPLLRSGFHLDRRYPMRAGVWDYEVFVLTKARQD